MDVSCLWQLAAIFSVEQLLHHLQQVLETHEVNWKHVLVFVSTLLVYDQLAQPSLSGKPSFYESYTDQDLIQNIPNINNYLTKFKQIIS